MIDVKLPVLKNFINNEFENPEISSMPLLNPSTGKLMGHQARSRDEALERAMAGAMKAHKKREWFQSAELRQEKLVAMADRLAGHAEELAAIESMNTGVCIQENSFLLNLLPYVFREAAEQISRSPDCSVPDAKHTVELWRKPWGPALCLAPWNAPAIIASHKLASALAAGAPVIMKPSEFTPFSLQRIFEIISEVELPTGVMQLIHGNSQEGGKMVKDKRIKAVSFTGGLNGGIAISKACSEQMKPVQLELGGHNPFIILPDASMDEVLDGLMAGMTKLNGQWCRAIGQIFCPPEMKDELLQGFEQRLQDINLGNALDPESDMGPLIHRQHLASLEQKKLEYQSAGANLCTKQIEADTAASFMVPTIVYNLPIEKDSEEMFGPIACLHTYEDAAEVIDYVNDSQFGLAAYVYGPDNQVMHMARQLEVGSVKGNGVTLTSLSQHSPRTAWGISGLGDEGGRESYEFFRGCSEIGIVGS